MLQFLQGPSHFDWGLIIASVSTSLVYYLPWFLYANRQGADCSFREILRFDAEGMIEASAVVFPRDGGRELDQLAIAESAAQAGEERVRDFDRRLGHGIGIFQN